MPLKSPVGTGPGNNRPKSWTCWFGPSLCKSNGFLLMTITVPSNNFCAFNWPTSVCWQKMLRYEPSKRITARQALEHEYFKDLEMVQWPASVVLWCVGICMSWVTRFIPFYEPLYSLPPSLPVSAFLSFSWIFWIWCALRCIQEYQLDYRLGLYSMKVNILHMFSYCFPKRRWFRFCLYIHAVIVISKNNNGRDKNIVMIASH